MTIFIYSLPQLLGSFIAAILGLFVLSRNWKRPLNRTFSSFGFLASLWLGSASIAYSLGSEQKMIIFKLMQVSYSAVICMVIPYLRLTTLITQSKSLQRWANLSTFIAIFFVATVWLTNWFIKDLYYFHFGLYPNVGWIHPFFLAWLFVSMTLIHLILFQGSRDEKRDSRDRNQAKYIWLAFIAVTPVIVDFIPNYGIDTYPAGYLFVLVFGAVSAYAIVRHQLMDIEVVIKRTAVFAGLFAFVYGTFTVVTILGQEFFKSTLGWNQWIATIPTVLIITFSLRPLETFLTNFTERWLFQKKYDYRELLRTFTNEILTVLDLSKLTEQTVAGLIKIIKLESAAVLLLDKDIKTYKMVAGSGVKEKEIVFKENDLIVSYLKQTNQHILKDKSVDKMEGDGELKDAFKKLNARICLPIELHDNLIGILSLGMKKSGEDFTQEDIDILNTLVRTEAIAISNAQLFDELSKTQAEAAQREKMAVIGTLAAGINHEICNPLGIVRGQCEMFLLNQRDGFYDGKSTEDILKISSDIMNKVIKETDRATGITKKLSSFAKPSKRSDLEEVQVEKEVDEVVGLIGHDLKLNNIDIQKDFPNNFPIILADKKQIQEVLFNIIRNAAQAMDKKSGKIVVSGFADNGNAVVRIADNGSGIPKDKIGQIFNPFYTTKAPGKGTGLGLFIVKQVVEKNRGTISLDSEVGVGTTFTLRFPAAVSLVAA